MTSKVFDEFCKRNRHLEKPEDLEKAFSFYIGGQKMPEKFLSPEENARRQMPFTPFESPAERVKREKQEGIVRRPNDVWEQIP